jgi:hypothetical protein
MDDHKRSKTDLIKELQELRQQNQNLKIGQENQPDKNLYNETLLHEMIAHSPISIQVLDKDGYSISVNQAHTDFFKAVPPPHYNLFNDPQLVKQDLAVWFNKLKQGEAVFFPDTRYNAHDYDLSFPDKTVWLKTLGFPLLNKQGIIEGYVVMHEDITERIWLEKHLEEKNNTLRGLYDNFQWRIEEVRKSLAAQLHDHLIQDLTAHKWELASIKKHHDNGQVKENIQKEIANVNKMIRTARNILTILWPTVIDSQGLEAAMEAYLGDLSNKF